MRNYLLAAIIAALAAPASEACVGRRAARVRTVTRTVVNPVRAVVSVPVRAVGVFASPCPGGVCPAPGVKK